MTHLTVSHPINSRTTKTQSKSNPLDSSESNAFAANYFDDLIATMRSRQFPVPNSASTPAQQIAQQVMTPVDKVLAPGEPASDDVKAKAIQAFELCSELFADAITAQLREHAGTRAFTGLFHSVDLDVYAMWCRIAKRTTSSWHSEETWLHKLACALIRDTELGEKMMEAHTCCSLGMSRRDTLAQIEEHHRQLGSHNTSAKSLLLLDLL